MSQRDLVGKGFWTLPVRGMARFFREDLAIDEAIGSPPYDQPGEREPTKLAELLRTHGGVTVVDSPRFHELVNGMSSAPGLLVAQEGFPLIQPTNPGVIRASFSFNLALKMDPVRAGEIDQKATRTEAVSLILGRIMSNRYQLGAGRIPDPDEDLGPNDSLTKFVSHGIVNAGAVAPPELAATDDSLTDFIRIIAEAMFFLDNAGRWSIQRP